MTQPATERLITLHNSNVSAVATDTAAEAEFRRYYIEENLQNTRAALGFGVALVSTLCVLDAVLMPAQFVEQAILIRILMMLLPLIAAFSASYFVTDRSNIPASFAALTMISGIAAILISSLALRHGYEFVHWEIVAFTCFNYFALGLTAKPSMFAGWSIFFTFVGFSFLSGAPTSIVAYGVLLLGTANLVGMHFTRRMEGKARELFDAGKELARSARIDVLTGLDNRRTFDEHIRQVWKQARRDEKSVAVILANIDHFKLYNDCYGNERGDECLQSIAEIVAASINRPLDLAARYGGGEFAILLYDPTESFLRSLSKKLCVKVAEKNIEHRASAVTPAITISAGASICLADGTIAAEKLIRRADDALYEAKTLGRNRAVVFNTEWGRQTGAQRAHVLI